MRAALYARVSTADQEPANQLAELVRYCQARNWEPVEYVDHGVSGSKDRRPALDRLLKDARRRKVDVVVCWRLDRLGRNLKHLITLGQSEAQGRSPDLAPQHHTSPPEVGPELSDEDCATAAIESLLHHRLKTRGGSFIMRMMLKVSMPTDASNAAFKDESLGKVLMGAIERLKPEAAYFFPEAGKRTALYGVKPIPS